MAGSSSLVVIILIGEEWVLGENEEDRLEEEKGDGEEGSGREEERERDGGEDSGTPFFVEMRIFWELLRCS